MHPSMMRMHAVVPRQHYELADHPAFRVVRHCAEHRVGPGLVELIGRSFGNSRGNVKMQAAPSQQSAPVKPQAYRPATRGHF